MSPLDTKVSGVLSTQITFVTTKEDPQISIPNNQERKARTLTCATKQNHPNTMCKERYIRLARKQNSPYIFLFFQSRGFLFLRRFLRPPPRASLRQRFSSKKFTRSSFFNRDQPRRPVVCANDCHSARGYGYGSKLKCRKLTLMMYPLGTVIFQVHLLC